MSNVTRKELNQLMQCKGASDTAINNAMSIFDASSSDKEKQDLFNKVSTTLSGSTSVEVKSTSNKSLDNQASQKVVPAAKSSGKKKSK